MEAPLLGYLDHFREVDPTQVGYKDPAVQVWETHVFPSFGLTADHDVVRRILASGPRRRINPDRSAVQINALLPTVSCGALGTAGRRCGRGVASVYTKDHGLIYSGVDCPDSDPPHRTNFYGTAVTAILEIIAAAYEPAGTEAMLLNLALRSRALRHRLTSVDAQLHSVNDELDGIAINEATAAHRKDEEGISFWRERRTRVLAQRRTLRNEHTDLTDRLQGLEDPSQLNRQLRIAAKLATDLPALFARSRKFQGRTRELINLLVRSMAIRQVSPGLMLFELELPTGQISHHLIITDNFRCSQPERLFAYGSLRRGDDPAMVAAAFGDERKFTGASRLANADTVQAFALLHAYFECVDPRDGEHRSVPDLAKVLLLAESTVWNAGLEGRLGPARLSATGALLFSPTEEELLWLSPWIGQQEVARRLGVHSNDLVSSAVLSEATGITGASLRAAGVKMQRGGTDRAGRRFLLRSALPPHFAEALASYSPEQREQRLRAALESELARADFDPSEADSWHRQHVVLATLRQRLGYGSVHTITRAARAGRVDQVLCRVVDPGRPAHSLTCFCFISPRLLNEGSLAEVVAWTRGVGPRATRTGDGHNRRVNRRGRPPRQSAHPR